MSIYKIIQNILNNGIFRSLIKDSFIYTLVQLLNKVVPFLLLPLIVRLISADEYGTYTLFISTELALLPFISLNTDGALNRYYFFKEIDYNSLLTTIFIIILSSSMLSFFVSYFIPLWFYELIGLSPEIFRWCILSSFATTIITSILILFRNSKRKTYYSSFLISNSILQFGVMWIFANYSHNSGGLITAKLIVNFLYVIIGFGLLVKLNYFSSLFNKDYLLRALKYSIPTIPHSFSAFIFVASDRYVINAYMTKADVGIYAAIAQVASIVSIFGNTFNIAWIPWIFEQLNKKSKEFNLLIVKISYLIKALFLFFSFILIFIFPFLFTLIFPSEYSNYKNISLFLILGYCFQAFYFIVSPYIYYTEKTQYSSIPSIIAAIINLLLNIILVPLYGIYGAAISSFISWFVLYILAFIISFRLYKMPWFLWIKQF